ncbi:MAG TPA: hypothetical protein VKA18_10055, partial [Alphaproteobacteria bacterium]|nr:hypothetical protein [Alphaproteobacteria bacterium]
HSYLANKALWDDYFFSSITPQPIEVEAFDAGGRNAEKVALDFFTEMDPIPLPNRRMTALETATEVIESLFEEDELTIADRIAAHLMVEGPFNVNSTSVEAWRALLASLKGKPVAYLDKDKALDGVTEPDEATTSGTPVAAVTMPNAEPGTGSDDPNDPEQWLGWRELNDTEIQELAEAIVRQVIRRGPFLSLSEFINRRLDSSDTDLSAKGTLQAALDDEAVSINANFRDNFSREFSGAETDSLSPAFPEAMEGPIAYGSAAYVDQADLLRNFAGQLTPRGDTFVIRTYGDALNAGNEVIARAWCEAVVQRVPEYIDSTADAPETIARDLSPTNKKFGRKFKIVSFRWLSKDEI